MLVFIENKIYFRNIPTLGFERLIKIDDLYFVKFINFIWLLRLSQLLNIQDKIEDIYQHGSFGRIIQNLRIISCDKEE